MAHRGAIESLSSKLRTRAANVVRRHPRLRVTYDIGRLLFKAFGDEPRECPLCGFNGRFLAFGSPPRIDCCCPRCGALERHRLLALYLRDRLSLSERARILHFAPEEPVVRMMRAKPSLAYVTADVQAGRADRMLNIEKILLSDASIDVVLCSHVLEHVDDVQALRELYRVLHPGGYAILLVPIVEGWDTTYEDPMRLTARERHVYFGQWDHVRIYGRDFRERVRAAGFELDEFVADGPTTVRYGLVPGERVFLATKPLR